MTTAPFPHHYEINLTATSAHEGVVGAGPRPRIIVGPPPQFGGDERWWGPEELLLSSVAACLMTTLTAVANKQALAATSFWCRATGTLNKTKEGLRFTEVELHVRLRGPDPEKLRVALELAKKHCLITNTLNVPVAVKADVAAEALSA